jgi:hypothetical protein
MPPDVWAALGAAIPRPSRLSLATSPSTEAARYRKLAKAQPKRMPALRIQMHLHGNASLF